jgi:hypothetical protein
LQPTSAENADHKQDQACRVEKPKQGGESYGVIISVDNLWQEQKRAKRRKSIMGLPVVHRKNPPGADLSTPSLPINRIVVRKI